MKTDKIKIIRNLKENKLSFSKNLKKFKLAWVCGNSVIKTKLIRHKIIHQLLKTGKTNRLGAENDVKYPPDTSCKTCIFLYSSRLIVAASPFFLCSPSNHATTDHTSGVDGMRISQSSSCWHLEDFSSLRYFQILPFACNRWWCQVGCASQSEIPWMKRKHSSKQQKISNFPLPHRRTHDKWSAACSYDGRCWIKINCCLFPPFCQARQSFRFQVRLHTPGKFICLQFCCLLKIIWQAVKYLKMGLFKNSGFQAFFGWLKLQCSTTFYILGYHNNFYTSL